MAHRAGTGAGDALQLVGGDHHHRHAAVTPGPAEVGGEVGGGLEIALAARGDRGLQHHMATGTFLGMEPEVATAGLLQADPGVLAVVAAHLHAQATGQLQFQGLDLAAPWRGGASGTPLAAVAQPGRQQALAIEFELLELGQKRTRTQARSLVWGLEGGLGALRRLQQQLVEVGEARLELLDPLLVGLDPGGDRRHRAPQFAGAAIEGLGFSHLLPAGIGQAKQGIGLGLQGAAALHLVEPFLLLPALGLLLGQGLLQSQAQGLGALLQAAAV